MKSLGVHWGQFPEEWQIGTLRSSINEASLIRDGAYVRGLSGMTCVIPSQEIARILNTPRYADARAEHDGEIITIRPNLRWTSDGFEIACWDGQVVRVAFALDTCDREVIAWCASTGGITGEMIRDLMLQSVERRFESTRVPRALQWLSDNGSCYRARETIDFAVSLGLVPCFTPVRSPQSNGMAEAFVKTFKRDYAYVHDRPDAQTVLSQLSAWFEDYNESHPHKALQMKSPREFIRSYQPATCPV